MLELHENLARRWLLTYTYPRKSEGMRSREIERERTAIATTLRPFHDLLVFVLPQPDFLSVDRQSITIRAISNTLYFVSAHLHTPAFFSRSLTLT